MDALQVPADRQMRPGGVRAVVAESLLLKHQLVIGSRARRRAPNLNSCRMSPAYLSQKLTRPLPTKDGGTLRTVLDARTYMLALSKQRETRRQWQRAAELLLGQADVAAFSKQVELAPFYDAKLDVSKVPAK
jgi:hypothetical protein